MADIMMCNGTNCPIKHDCYRHTANANEYMQSYFVEIPIKEDGTCEHFWQDERHKILRKNHAD